MADDATWWVIGRPELYPDAGTRTKGEMADAWLGMYRLLDGALAMNPLSMVAEGDRVAAEVRCQAVTQAGKVYANDYHLRQGQVRPRSWADADRECHRNQQSILNRVSKAGFDGVELHGAFGYLIDRAPPSTCRMVLVRFGDESAVPF